MAVDMATAIRSEITVRSNGASASVVEPYTAVAVFDGQRWTAICRELDIASDGDTAEEAFWSLKAAVREALAVATERGVSAGVPVPDEELLAFMTSHKGPDPVSTNLFTVD